MYDVHIERWIILTMQHDTHETKDLAQNEIRRRGGTEREIERITDLPKEC